jgi:hypothetical protein
VVVAVVMLWVVLVTTGGLYLAAAVSYYRALAFWLAGVGLGTGVVAVLATWRGNARRALGTLLAVAIAMKVAHWGYYVPEWNYRRGQGPWGRAIGQWIPPGWTLYTVHAWPPDLAFAIERPVIQLADPRLLRDEDRSHPLFVLLLPSEFEHWPKSAPPLIKVRTFQDQRGSERVLARTEGDLSRLRFIEVE